MEDSPTYGTGAPPVETPPEAQSSKFKCEDCGREFDSAIALQTHTIRAHKQFWSTNKPRAYKPRQPGARKAKARSELNPQYVKYRDRYRAQGLNAKGKPYKRGPYARSSHPKLSKTCPVCSRKYSTRGIMGQHLRTAHGKSLQDFPVNGAAPAPTDRTAQGREWLGKHVKRGSKNPKHKGGSAECPVCHNTFSKMYLPHHVKTQHGKRMSELKAWDGITRQPEAERPAKPAQSHQGGRHVMFCPVCGTNIQNVQTAVNFGE